MTLNNTMNTTTSGAVMSSPTGAVENLQGQPLIVLTLPLLLLLRLAFVPAGRLWSAPPATYREPLLDVTDDGAVVAVAATNEPVLLYRRLPLLLPLVKLL
jgi:hypothetical protein